MRIIYDLDEMTETARGWLAGGSVGLIPVTGNIHAGHVALIRSSLQRCELSVVSIVDQSVQVNSDIAPPLIPFHLATNLQLLDHEHVDVVFIPRLHDFYPPGSATEVLLLGPIAERLEGAIQPGMIRSVATSMTKLFQLVRPDKVFLGQKKAQQVALIRKLASDLNIDLTIHVSPIVRESDGMAVSNHMNLLSFAERQAVSVIHRALLAGKSMIENGEHNTWLVKQEVAHLIAAESLLKLDYVTICDPNTFEELSENVGADLPDLLLAVSVSVGTIRILDNMLWDSRGFWLT